jgi:paraquat-inducible protein B
MSKRADPKAIGAFVIGALALAVAGLLFFGASDFFSEKEKFVLYFDGSVRGLSIGSPVTFRGVKIGTVSDILVRIDRKTQTIRIPVVVELDPGRLGYMESELRLEELGLDELIDRGLRAQLELESLVTGQLLIEMDFHPETKVELVGGLEKYQEIPTVPTKLQAILNRIEEVPIEQLLQQVGDTLRIVEKTFASPQFQSAMESLGGVLKQTEQIARNINKQMEPLMGKMEALIGSTREFVRSTDKRVATLGSGLENIIGDSQKVTSSLERHIPSLLESLRKTNQVTQAALNQARKTFAVMDEAMEPDSPLIYGVTRALEEISGAARSLRVFAEYLQQHPEALLQGKQGY